MNDDKLIDLISDIWVANGGDAEGLDWCYKKLKNTIKSKEK